jgi:26S proteasome regulatory subunit T3
LLQIDDDTEDLYTQLKALQRQEEFLDIQEEYIKDEMRNLKRELIRAKEVSQILSLDRLYLVLIYYNRN